LYAPSRIIANFTVPVAVGSLFGNAIGHFIEFVVTSMACIFVLLSSQNTVLVGFIPAPFIKIISLDVASAGPLCGKDSPIEKKENISLSLTSE